MTDARFDAAHATDQSRGRGWAFEPDDREPSRMGIAVVILAVIVAAASLIAGVIA